MNLNFENRIREIIFNDLGDRDIKVIHFGSRAKGKEHRTSDYDIALYGKKPIEGKVLRKIKEDLENSTIPYKIDIVDFSIVSEELRKQIKKDGIIWKPAR